MNASTGHDPLGEWERYIEGTEPPNSCRDGHPAVWFFRKTCPVCLSQASHSRTIDEKNKRIAELEALLDRVPHYVRAIDYPRCSDDCPRCARERMKGGAK